MKRTNRDVPDSDNDMNRLEQVLKNALARREAPDGFADRVLARASERVSRQQSAPQASLLRIFTQPLVRWAALVAFATAMIVGVHLHNLRRERRRRGSRQAASDAGPADRRQ